MKKIAIIGHAAGLGFELNRKLNVNSIANLKDIVIERPAELTINPVLNQPLTRAQRRKQNRKK